MHKLNCILTQSEKGGSGKSTVASAIVAGLTAGNEKICVVDADDGNSGYIQQCGKGSAVELPWATGADQLPGWMDHHLTDCGTLVIDCGANLIASCEPINRFLGELVMKVKGVGGHVTALSVVSPNAPGTGRLPGQMRRAYGDFANVISVENNTDGSGAIERELENLSMPIAKFSHIQPGIQAVRLLRQVPLLQMLESPPQGRGTALASYAHTVACFMDEPAVSYIFNQKARTRFANLASKAPGPLFMYVDELTAASDIALAANLTLTEKRLAAHATAENPHDYMGIADAALKWIAAENAYMELF